MLDPTHNPFFEQLKADSQAGIEQADRGETIPLEDSLARAAVLKIAELTGDFDRCLFQMTTELEAHR